MHSNCSIHHHYASNKQFAQNHERIKTKPKPKHVNTGEKLFRSKCKCCHLYVKVCLSICWICALHFKFDAMFLSNDFSWEKAIFRRKINKSKHRAFKVNSKRWNRKREHCSICKIFFKSKTTKSNAIANDSYYCCLRFEFQFEMYFSLALFYFSCTQWMNVEIEM